MRSASKKAHAGHDLGHPMHLRQTRFEQSTRPLVRVAVVKNYVDLLVAYGERVANETVNEVARRIQGVEISGVEEIQVDTMKGSPFIELTTDSSTDVDTVTLDEAILVSAASRPLMAFGARVLPRISIGSPGDFGSDRNLFPAATFTESDLVSPGGYKHLMWLAVRCQEALLGGSITLFAQPVLSAAGDRVLYRECLARKVDPDTGDLQEGPSVFIPALERIGMTRWFDRAIVRKTIDLLSVEESSFLGCNISALSAVNDAWWASTLRFLDDHPTIASRLVVELTETAACPDMAAAIEFCDVLRQKGCRIAIDDFGAGFGSIGFSLRVKPDIVKIDMNVIRELRGSEGTAVLKDMLVFLSKVATDIVIEGIETEGDRELAVASGADWLQGYRMGAVIATHHDRAWPNPNFPLLLSRLRGILLAPSTAATPRSRLIEIMALAKNFIEDRTIGLIASHTQTIFERYVGELHCGISGLDLLRSERRRALRHQEGLDESFLMSIDAIAKRHGTTLRLQWIRSRVPELVS